MSNDHISAPLRASLLPALTLLLTACNLQAQADTTSPELKASIETLKNKSLKRLSYVPSGGFWLGDPGQLMTDNLKESGAVLGPDAKPGDNPPFTINEDNKPPRWITLDAFSIQQLKVTYADFDVYTQASGLPKHPPEQDDSIGGEIWRDARKVVDAPAGVSWPQARAYCQWLGKTTGLPFDLPTEAQWEFAASNGRKTYREVAPTDNGAMQRGRNHPTRAWIEEQRGSRGVLYPIGRFPASKLQLHDLVGNGFEWTLDWYAPNAYLTMQQTHNPTGPNSGTEKVKRGFPTNEDIAFTGYPHTERYKDVPEGKRFKGAPWPYAWEGFRCVVNQPDPIQGTFTAGPPPVR